MAKRRRIYSDKTIKTMIKEGRGKGEGSEYKPWITVRDIPSLGRCTETAGWKTGRIHHLLSNLETNYFYHLEWADNIIDIREQYPLLDEFDSYEEAMEIAEQIGVEYPIVPKTRTPNVMTTDFLITLDINGEIITKARTTKYAKDLSDRRTVEKLEIERLFWERRNVDWKIVTEKQINESLAFNVGYVHKCKTLDGYNSITPELVRYVNKELCAKNSTQKLSLANLTMEVDKELELKPGSSLFIVKHLIANKLWTIDITKKIDTSKPLIFKTDLIVKAKEENV